MKPSIVLVLAATLALVIPAYTMIPVLAQVPEHCGYSFDHRCALPSQEEADKLLEEFPDAIVEVNEELFESIPEDDREDAEGIIDKGPLEDPEDIEEVEEQLEEEEQQEQQQEQQQPQPENNFQPNPQPNLPPAQQSGAGLLDTCKQSGLTEAQCNNFLLSDDPGQFCTTLKLAGLPCPKIQDPDFTFGNPEAALKESNDRIRNTQSAVDQCIAAGVCKP